MSEEHEAGEVSQLSQRAQKLLASGRFAEAAELFGQLLDRLDAAGGDDINLRADFARLRGYALREAGNLEDSTHSLESAIALLQERTRDREQDFLLATALYSLALNYDARGETEKATRARADMLGNLGRVLAAMPDHASELVFALSVDLKSSGHADWKKPVEWIAYKSAELDDDAALRVLRKLHQFWLDREDGTSAGRVVIEALDRIRALDDEALSANFNTVHNLAWTAIESNLLDVAEEIVEIMKRVVDSSGTNGAYAVRRLEVFSNRRSDQGEEFLDNFRTIYELALASFGAEDSRTRMSRRELADALASMDRHDEAIEIYRDVLEVELNVGEDRLTTASIATSLAMSLDATSSFADAVEMHRLAFSIRSEILGPDHPDTNRSRYEVAELSRVLDRVDESEFYFLQAMDVETRIGGTKTELGALIKNNLADLYLKLGRYDQARPLLEEALAIRSELHGEDSERVWRSRQTLAIWERDTGDFTRAIELARAATAHPEQAGSAHSASWHMILAGALLKKGAVEEAEEPYRRLYKAVQRNDIGGAVSWEVYLEVLEGLTICQVIREDWVGAVETASGVLDIVREQLPDLVRNSSEMQLIRFTRRVITIQSLWLWSLIRGEINDHGRLGEAFELVQFTKGLLTRYLRWRQPGVANVEHIALPDYEAVLRELRNDIRRLYEELTAEFLELGDAEAFAKSMPVLAKRANLRYLERCLAQYITDWEIILDQSPVLSENLLPEAAMALEIVLVRDVAAERVGKASVAHRYVAFVLGPDRDGGFELVDLGLSDDLDTAVDEMRGSLMGEPWVEGGREPAWSRISRFLGNKLVARFWNRIRSAQHLLIAPDGAMVALPFEILSTPEAGYLIDTLQVSYLMRTGELEGYRHAFRIEGDPLILAGPDFDLPYAETRLRGELFDAEYLLARSLVGDNRFEPLPEARSEGIAVAELLGVEPLLGVWALAPELLRSDSPEIIHLSTHGFCLPLERTEDDVLALAAPLGNAVDRRMVLTDPMQRSGLAMSGANAVLNGRPIPPETGNALVYASDIQQMNLQRTDLVVLSACRSGLGDMEIGDGAHGLRRAFLAAGCRSVVSALWDVPDKSARKLVERFYKQLLEGAGRLEALAEARAFVRAEHPRDPIHWAGFVLDGNFAPLWRFSDLWDLKVASISFRTWGITSDADPNAFSRLAERLAQGPSVDPDDVTSPRVVTLRRALARDDLDDELRVYALSLYGNLASRLGDHDRALANYRTILEMDSLSSDERLEYEYNVAGILLQTGRLVEAIAGYSELLNQAPSAHVRSMTRVNRGNAFLSTGRLDDAISDFTAVIDDSEAPTDQRFMAYMSRSDALKTNDPSGALSDVDAALKLGIADNFETWKLHFHRAHLLIRLGDPGSAIEEVNELEQYTELSEEYHALLADLRSKALGK